MNIWLIGQDGMLGSTIARHLTLRRITHTGTSRYQVDITDARAVDLFIKTEQPTHIVNAAAYTNVDQAETEFSEAHRINVQAIANIATSAHEYGARVFHFSTDYVFDGTAVEQYTEDHPCRPINAYGKTKLEGEKLLQKLCPNSCIIRTSWLFGRGGNNFVSRMVNLMTQQQTLRIVDDQWGRPTYTEDLAIALINLLEEVGIYHYANSGETTWYHYAQAIHGCAAKAGIPVITEEFIPVVSSTFDNAALRPRKATLSTTKIENLFAEEPRHWQEALEEFLRNFKSTPLQLL